MIADNLLDRLASLAFFFLFKTSTLDEVTKNGRSTELSQADSPVVRAWHVVLRVK